MLSKVCETFSMSDSSFLIQKYKESAGRVVIYKEFGVANSYTLECSLCGTSIGSRKDIHYSMKMLLDIGKQFCQALADMTDPTMCKTALREIQFRYSSLTTSSMNPTPL
jgi:hypothetical protein